MGSGRCGGGGRGGAARMTMALLDPPLALRTADLDDATECARIDAFVHDHRGTPFHFTGWSRDVERGCGQRAHYLVAETADGAIAGVLPTSAIRSSLFGEALVSAGFPGHGRGEPESGGAGTGVAGSVDH